MFTLFDVTFLTLVFGLVCFCVGYLICCAELRPKIEKLAGEVVAARKVLEAFLKDQ